MTISLTPRVALAVFRRVPYGFAKDSTNRALTVILMVALIATLTERTLTLWEPLQNLYMRT